MREKAPAETEGTPPTDVSEQPESWLREAARAPLPPVLPTAGDVVGGKYRIEELLGRGGMGVVFRARHTVSEKPVALKWMLRPTTDEQARRRFEREARAAGRIDHPNVIDLYDVGEEGECSYLVMELLRGDSLRTFFSRGPIDPRDAIDVLIPAMRGVAAAHRAGVIHRDLKPDNIFLCDARDGDQREVKVLDFGVSSITSIEAVDSTLTQEGALLGSLAYMSPEQLRNPHDVDLRTDVYAFGVIFFEVLTGELPFQGATQSALIVAIMSEQPRRLSQLRPIPIELEAVVLRALAREREERYSNMNGLIDALLPFATPVRNSAQPRDSLGAASQSAPSPSQQSVSPPAQLRSPPQPSPAPLAVSVASANSTQRAEHLPLSRGHRVSWVAAAVLVLLAFWIAASTWRGAGAPVSKPLDASRQPEQPKASTLIARDVHAHDVEAREAGPAAPVATPSLAPSNPAPVVSAGTPSTSSAHEVAKPKRARSAAAPSVERSPVRSTARSAKTVEDKERALFSGRK